MNRTLVIIGSSARGCPDGISASDRAAIGLALRQSPGAVHVYCPAADERAMILALAAGAADVRSLTGIESQAFDVALVGHGVLDQTGEQLAGLLAENNNATLVFDVLDFERAAAGWVVTRDQGRGRREELVVAGPAVFVVSPHAQRPPYVSRYRLQTAAEKLRQAGVFQDTGEPAVFGDGWQPARPRAKLGRRGPDAAAAAGSRLDDVFGLATPAPAGDREHILQADAATCARHLVRYLAHHGFVERDGLARTDDAVTAAPALHGSQSLAETNSSVDVSAGGRRGPRRADEPPQRIARRPRQVELLRNDSSQGDIPPAAAPSASAARRPRSADQTAPARHRGPRPIS